MRTTRKRNRQRTRKEKRKGKTNKCIYTDEVKRLSREIQMLKKQTKRHKEKKP